MRKADWILAAAAALAATATPAGATPCGGGSVTISATSDTPLTGLAYNVGQKAIFAAQLSGISPVNFAWTIPGPYIKDYPDNLGTQAGAAAPSAWLPTPITSTDLQQSSLSLYWQPSPAQTHPNTGGPETRAVSLTVMLSGGLSCTTGINVTVERNLTDPNRQPEDYYTSNHRAPTTTNPGLGAVIDEHMYWHNFVGGGPSGSWLQFLPWHGYFLRRFDEWRQTFGYPPVAPWYPGRPLPTGPEFDHPASLRLAYNPANNRIPTYLTLAGGTAADPRVSGSVTRLADYSSLDLFSDSFEGVLGPPTAYHGLVHCNIGTNAGGFFDTSGPGFGSMCKSSSPKDPMFWRWHGFIDRLYRNYCRIKGLTNCHVAANPAANPWMRDNAADTGAVPSPAPRWMSPDIWNRTSEDTSDACMPRTSPPALNTVGGVTRNCGSEAQHENPVAGQPNFLYATLRNTGTTPQRNVYAEVAVYIANASTGLSWPADFTMLPESRQFITLNLEPGQVTAIGPLPWTPPSPSPSDHWCIYIRILSVQEAPLVEGTVVDTNVANSNSIAWRNLKIVNLGERTMSSRFVVRNVRREGEALALQIDAAPALLNGGRLILQLDPALQRAFAQTQMPDGVRALGRGRYLVTGMRTILEGFRLPPRGQGIAEIQLEGARATGDVIVSQRSSAGIDGGVTLRVADRRRQGPSYR